MTIDAKTADWTAIDGLDAAESGPRTDRPAVKVLAHTNGATVVRIGFTGDQTMPDHQASAPILIMGQRGSVDVTVDGTTTTLGPGTALHIAAGVRHELTASGEAAVTLMVLNADQP